MKKTRSRDLRLLISGSISLLLCLSIVGFSQASVAKPIQDLSEREVEAYCKRGWKFCISLKQDIEDDRIFNVLELLRIKQWVRKFDGGPYEKMREAFPSMLEYLVQMTDLLSERYGIPIDLGHLHVEHLLPWSTVAFGQISELESALQRLNEDQLLVLQNQGFQIELFTNSTVMKPAALGEANILHIDNFGFSVFPMSRGLFELPTNNHGRRVYTFSKGGPGGGGIAGFVVALILGPGDTALMAGPQAAMYLAKHVSDTFAKGVNKLTGTQALREDQADSHTLRMRQFSADTLTEVLERVVERVQNPNVTTIDYEINVKMGGL